MATPRKRASGLMAHWQHVTPQEGGGYHVPKPKFAGTLMKRPPCFYCDKPLVWVGPGEGPEGLKALFRL